MTGLKNYVHLDEIFLDYNSFYIGNNKIKMKGSNFYSAFYKKGIIHTIDRLSYIIIVGN